MEGQTNPVVGRNIKRRNSCGALQIHKSFYAILCVKFVREVRYFTSKVAIFSLSALVVRKVTGGEIIELRCVKFRAMPGVLPVVDGRGGKSHQGRSSISSFDKQNKQSSKHQTKFIFLTIIVFFSLPRYFDVPIIHRVASK